MKLSAKVTVFLTVRVKEQFENELIDDSSGSGNRSASLDRNHHKTVAVWRCFCHLVDEIMYSSKALGKDGKFQLFICLSVRLVFFLTEKPLR